MFFDVVSPLMLGEQKSTNKPKGHDVLQMFPL